ncbi:MAG: NADPH-dependent FMN reductase, partial [Candidatus Cryptobacteroides sp.]
MQQNRHKSPGLLYYSNYQLIGEYLDYSALPMMDQDIEFPAPDEVSKVREKVAEADALWIFSPEYNYSYPGHLKNLIDWL